MTFQFPYTSTPSAFTVFVKGRPHSVSKDSDPYRHLMELVQSGVEVSEDEVMELVSPRRALEAIDGISIDGEVVSFAGEVLHEVLTRRILDVVRDGFPLDSWHNLVRNIRANPAPWAMSEIFLWMESGNLPHTPDGHVLAYKRVRNDYQSVATDRQGNRVLYEVGTVVEMPGGRGSVDPNRDKTCSTGLHFCSFDYLDKFSGDRVLVVKINPADIVSIPSDYGNTKGRCWRMEVVDELPLDEVLNQEPVWPSVVDHEVIHETEGGAIAVQVDVDEDAPVDDIDDMLLFHEEVRTNGDAIAEEAERHLADIAEATDPKRDRKRPRKSYPRYPVVESEVAGRITRTRYRELVKEHGGPSGIAEALGVSVGVVRGWKKRLGI